MEVIENLRRWATGLWEPFASQARESQKQWPPTGEVAERLRRIEDEREIEKVFRRYHHFYDAHDIDGVVNCFTDDAVQVNGRGTFIGRDSIRRSYQYLIDNQQVIFHYGTGVLVTLDPDDPDAAILTARHFDIWQPTVGKPHAAGGTYINRMRRVEGRWLIAEQRITFNFKFEVELSPRVLGSNQAPAEFPFSQVDLVDPRHLLS
ncbi:nuclear transport factor 2 family protein [Gordonia rhizosphera]|uniref:SnoaL-like domain-containing protein n=1 Tax=Gordonia rhizosphera NBRC 16068 TaxID=1108045 RepID=K6X0Q1_9ACTN|nr:nuclear transport factor 2 family protein [Gordonia rhizosphera]GAB92359.1 hypothetical protein GORHZ_171_00320 [Gordonia rhizosphera NBRC 16068]